MPHNWFDSPVDVASITRFPLHKVVRKLRGATFARSRVFLNVHAHPLRFGEVLKFVPADWNGTTRDLSKVLL